MLPSKAKVLLANDVAISASGLIRKAVKDNMVFYIGYTSYIEVKCIST